MGYYYVQNLKLINIIIILYLQVQHILYQKVILDII
nr:MAG TPA: hypothetical protein [Bacteriophage sp.]